MSGGMNFNRNKLHFCVSFNRCMLYHTSAPLSFKGKKKFALSLKKHKPSRLALKHFDFFYGPIYGDQWPSIRLALLSDQKYCAVLNNFVSHPERTDVFLGGLGTFDWVEKLRTTVTSITRNIGGTLPKDQELIGREGGDMPFYDQRPAATTIKWMSESLSNDDVDDDESISRGEEGLMRFMPTDADLELLNRPIDPTLWTPTDPTKQLLLSNDHRLVEPLQLESELELQIPDLLSAYSFRRGNITEFPQGQLCPSSGAVSYYLMDASSVLPVIALDVQQGERVLDLCAAPGGKTLLMLQTQLPSQIVANDVDRDRLKKMRQMLESYLPPQASAIRSRVSLLCEDPTTEVQSPSSQLFGADAFERVLVDAPCTTDRLSVLDDRGNLFQRSRAAERMALPHLQTKLLLSGLRLLQPGGTLVYATCSLSPMQNQQVVRAAVSMFGTRRLQIVKLDALEAACRKAGLFRLAKNVELGTLVLPFMPLNFGPLFLCKIRKMA